MPCISFNDLLSYSVKEAEMKLRDIPSVNEFLDTIDQEDVHVPREYVVSIIRDELAQIRELGKDGTIPLAKEEIVDRVRSSVLKLNRPSLAGIINGTGIILHTGLGRAPFSRKMLKKVTSEMEGYSALELDLKDGKRGERVCHVSPLINALTGSEASVVVNNNAAAVLLCLNTLAEGKDVIVSRGQLVEIGGLFRIPDVIFKSGAQLVEVGTTNRTHFQDYDDVISSQTGVVLVVHTSNYRIHGFTREVSVTELVPLTRKRRIPLVVDLGSGALFDLKRANLPHEPVVSDILRQGADLVTFSGDKLLGGPQSGVICGKKKHVFRLHRNPLYRALRCDKMTLSLLEQTLRSYRQIPPKNDNLTYRLLTTSRKALMKKGDQLLRSVGKAAVRRLGVTVVPSHVEAGSGSLPTEEFESAALRFRPSKTRPEVLALHFRNFRIPILGYISSNRFHIDLKAVLPRQHGLLAEALREIAPTLE